MRREEIAGLPPDGWDQVIVATGPLTSPALAEAIRALSGEDALAFFDAIAADRLSRQHRLQPRLVAVALRQARARWHRGRLHQLPASTKPSMKPLSNPSLAADKTEFKDWERDTPYFEGCLPIEVMAERGPETLRFGPMKPVGLTDPATGRRPYAVLQLRQDNALGTLYNLVGFQTKLKHGEQVQCAAPNSRPGTGPVRASRRPASQHFS